MRQATESPSDVSVCQDPHDNIEDVIPKGEVEDTAEAMNDTIVACSNFIIVHLLIGIFVSFLLIIEAFSSR